MKEYQFSGPKRFYKRIWQASHRKHYFIYSLLKQKQLNSVSCLLRASCIICLGSFALYDADMDPTQAPCEYGL